MLAAMNDRSFVVTIAYTKTEVIQAAVFGLLFLGDPLTVPIVVAILIATAGVWLMSFKAGVPMQGGLRPTLLGLFSGAMLALSAVGYRGAILSLGRPDFVVTATFTLAFGLLPADHGADALSGAARPRRCWSRSRAPGGRRCSPASWARPRRSSGSSPSR